MHWVKIPDFALKMDGGLSWGIWSYRANPVYKPQSYSLIKGKSPTHPYTQVAFHGTRNAIMVNYMRYSQLINRASMILGTPLCQCVLSLRSTKKTNWGAPYFVFPDLLMSHIINSPLRALVNILLLNSELQSETTHKKNFERRTPTAPCHVCICRVNFQSTSIP